MNNTLSDSQLEAMIKSAVNSSGPLPPDEKFSQLVSALRELQERRKADSEPVAEVVSIYGDPEAFGEREIRPLVGIQQMPYGTKLYRHVQPAPVVPEEKSIPNTLSMYAVDAVAAIAEVKGWNACRAAMLQAGTLTNEGTKQAWTGIPDIDNAINMLDRIDTLESCDDDRIEAVKTVLRGLAGNSPLIQDGYVMVPKEMTDEIGEAIAMQANCCGGIALDIYDAMIAAAPHDTPALNSLQSVDRVTGGWIPVSERMPEIRKHWLDVTVIIAISGEKYGSEAQYCSDGNFRWGRDEPPIEDVTHWMPMPAAPREVK